MTQSHKSVTMVELFYDLIFAYAVGRMAQALALPTHGFIAPRMLGEFFDDATCFLGDLDLPNCLSQPVL